jgi:probable HAF family extracellular repeat protein
MKLNAVIHYAVLAVLAGPFCSLWANRYTIVDLGGNEIPVSVNAVNVVAANRSEPRDRGQVYRGGRWRNLPAHSDAAAINRDGAVVGINWQGHPMLWPHNSDAVDIHLPNGTQGSASGINNAGTVVGYFLDAQASPQCYFWSINEGATDMSEGGILQCTAHDINEIGEITGEFIPAAGGEQHAFFWSQDKFTDLGVLLGTSYSVGLAINNGGVVVGASFLNRAGRAFMWNGSMVDLDPNRKYYLSEAVSINKAGDMVGFTRAAEGVDSVAVRFAHSKIVSLDTEVNNLGDWHLETAASINDKGVIVGVGVHSTTRQTSAYMLLPTN